MAICVGCFVFCTTSLSIEFPPLHIWLIAHHDISVLVWQCSEAPNILINPQSFFSRRIWNWNKRSNICCGIPSNVCVHQYKSKLVNLWNASNIIWEGTCALRQRQGQTNAILWSTWNTLPSVIFKQSKKKSKFTFLKWSNSNKNILSPNFLDPKLTRYGTRRLACHPSFCKLVRYRIGTAPIYVENLNFGWLWWWFLLFCCEKVFFFRSLVWTRC